MSKIFPWLQSLKFQHLGDLLVAPLFPGQENSKNRRARVLSTVFLVSTVILVVLPILIITHSPDMQFHAWLISDVLCAIVFLVAYVLNRWRSSEMLLVVTITASNLAIILPSVFIDATSSYEVFFYLVASTLISALILPLRRTLFLSGFSTVTLLVCAPFMKGLSTEAVVLGPVLFNLAMSVLLITVIYSLRAETDQQRTQLAASEQRYRMISEMISDYAYLVRIEPDGRMKREWITEESYQRITGFTVQHLDNMLEEDRLVLEYPEDLRDAVTDRLTRAIRGEANSQEIYFTPKGLQSKRWLHIYRQPIYNSEGKITHMLGVAQDITARKEAELRLRESEERYRALSELMSDYAFFIRVEDGKLTLEWMTDSFERLTGYHPDEIFPNNTAKLFHTDDIPRLMADIDTVMQGKETISEVRMVTKGGEPRTLIYRRRPMWDEAETAIIGYYTVVEDITARKLTEAQERKLQAEEEQLRMVRQFMLAISHDFRTLLATIETSRYLVERGLPPDARERVQPKLDRIHASVNHINTQLDNLQLVTSISQLQVSPTDLNALLEGICLRLSADAAETSIQMRYIPEPDLELVLIDPDKIRTAVGHLVRNALANTPAGGSIELRTRQHADTVAIQVQDTGRGIAPKDMPHIFEAFYRGDMARQVDLGGLGLGLTLVKMIVDGHEGKIAVESEPGQGTCFEIRLPYVRSK